MSGQAVRTMRGRAAIYHLLVQDPTGQLPCKFFHGGYLEGRLKQGQLLVLHGKAEIDKMRPARIEMVNPQMELLSSVDHSAAAHEADKSAPQEEIDSTEVGRIVPISQAVGTFGSRPTRRPIHTALQTLDPRMPDVLPEDLRARLAYPARFQALAQTHFPAAEESVDALNEFRSPAQQRLIFEEFFLYQLSLALDRRATREENAIAFRLREENIREALKRILPFKPTAAQKRVLAEIAADLEKPAPMNRLLQGDVGSGKTIVALQAAVVAILDEPPPGRTPIEPHLTPEPHLPGVWNSIRGEVEAGHQAYIVYPVIEESKLELKAAIEEYERLSREVFPKLRLGLLHGRLSSDEKDEVMQRFRKNEIQILVATTVVEVGVDVPNATVMVIEHAERFGLSQLHQLRGRIGRGAQKSHCVLVGPVRMTDAARTRLETMLRTSNGFA